MKIDRRPMASRLNLLFHAAPKQFLERTVLFTHELTAPRNRITHHVDIQPLEKRAIARMLEGLHLYTDTPLASYFVPPGEPVLIPKVNPPYRFVFMPEFTCCRLLIRPEGPDWLRVECETGLIGPMPPAETLDSFAYWDYTSGDLVGAIRATAVLVKEPNAPWTMFMQQIVGTPGHEVVRQLFSRPLRY
jgi:hypothetical protein